MLAITAEGKRLARRAELVKEIDSIKEELPGQEVVLIEAHEKALAKRLAAEKIYRQALQDEIAAEHAKNAHYLIIRNKLWPLERELIGSADPRLKQVQDWLEEQMQFTRLLRPAPVFDSLYRYQGIDVETKRLIEQRMAVIMDAHRSVRDVLPQQAIDAKQVTHALTEIFLALPPVPPDASTAAREPELPEFLAKIAQERAA